MYCLEYWAASLRFKEKGASPSSAANAKQSDALYLAHPFHTWEVADGEHDR